MSRSIKGLAVTFEADLSEEGAELVMAAIRQLKGICDVTAVPLKFDDHYERSRIRNEIYLELLQVMRAGAKK